MWCMPIVIVPMSNKRTACLFTGKIALGTDGCLRVQAHVADAIIAWKQFTNCIGTVIHNDQFTAGIILSEEILDRLQCKRAAIIRGHNTANEGLACIFYRER